MAEYIEREKTVELLRSLGNREYRKEKGTIQDAIKMISYPEYTPAADVAPVVHGRWVTHYRSGTPVAEGHVSTCCNMWNNRKSDYCPSCGAKMDIENGGNGDEAD